MLADIDGFRTEPPRLRNPLSIVLIAVIVNGLVAAGLLASDLSPVTAPRALWPPQTNE